MIIREFITRLGFDADESKVRRFDAAVKGLAIGLAAAVAGMTTVALATDKLVGDTARAANEIENFARVANTGTTEFQRFAAASSEFGIEQDKLADILKDVNDRVGDFNTTGGGPMLDFFEQIAPKIGLTADAFRDLSGAEALQLYVTSLEKAGASQQEMTFYMEAMASDATLLLPLLRDNGQMLTEMGDAAEKSGVIMDESVIASAREFTRSLKMMRMIIHGLRMEIGARLLPIMRPMIDSMTQFLMQNREIIASKLAQAFDVIGSAISNLMGIFIGLYDAFSPIISMLNELGPMGWAAAAGVLALVFPFGRIHGLLIAGGLLLALEDLGAWMSGQPSLIGKMLGPYEDFADAVAEWVEYFGGLENVVMALVALKFAPWLFAVARGTTALAAALTTLGGSAAAGGLGALSRIAALGGVALGAGVGASLLLGGGARVPEDGVQPDFINPDTGVPAGSLADRFMSREVGPSQSDMVIPNPNYSGITFDDAASSMEDSARELQQYLDGITPGGNTINLDMNQSITVPPGTTAEQLEVIRRETERALSREIDRATKALED